MDALFSTSDNPVEDRARRHLFDEAGEHLGEVSRQWALLARLQEAAVRRAKGHAAIS
jgi:hypothetical protein